MCAPDSIILQASTYAPNAAAAQLWRDSEMEELHMQ